VLKVVATLFFSNKSPIETGNNSQKIDKKKLEESDQRKTPQLATFPGFFKQSVVSVVFLKSHQL